MFLLVIPFVSAECTWYNPFTWGECFDDFFGGDDTAYDLCKNKTTINYATDPVYTPTDVKGECDNKIEVCTGQYANESWYKYIKVDVLSWVVTEYNKTICEETGTVIIGDKVIALKEHYCKANQCGYKAVCYSTDKYGRGRYGTGCRLDGEEGVDIKDVDDIEIDYPFRYEIKEKEILSDGLNKKWKKQK